MAPDASGMLLAVALVVATACPARAATLPEGGVTVHGTVDIVHKDDSAMSLMQRTSLAIVDWRSFNLAEGAGIDVVAPSSDAVLMNRVNGPAPSVIAGSLRGNGAVWLVNPNGIEVTSTGEVQTAAFLASTLALGNDAFVQAAQTRSFPLADMRGAAPIVVRGAVNVAGVYRGPAAYSVGIGALYAPVASPEPGSEARSEASAGASSAVTVPALAMTAAPPASATPAIGRGQTATTFIERVRALEARASTVNTAPIPWHLFSER